MNSSYFAKRWILSSYFCMGLVGTLLTSGSAIFFKNIGMSNAFSASISSLLLMAYMMKPALTPFLHGFSGSKRFILHVQVAIFLLIVFAGFSLIFNFNIWFVVAILFIVSILGSSQDALIDGKYVTSLSKKMQARYCGLQSFSWNMGSLFIAGGVVSLSGLVYESNFVQNSDWWVTWGLVFIFVSIVFLLLSFVSFRAEPQPNSLQQKKSFSVSLKSSYSAFFNKEHIWMMLLLVFFYKFFIAMAEKILPLFLMDSVSNGGMGLSNSSVGSVNGTIGMIALLIGSFFGGWLVSQYGLKRLLIFLCLVTNLPILFIMTLSFFGGAELFLISTLIFLEKFCLGLGSVGQMLFIMQVMSDRNFGMIHYSFGTGVLTVSVIVAGVLSGYLQQMIGYPGFFLLCAVGIPVSVIVARHCVQSVMTSNSLKSVSAKDL